MATLIPQGSTLTKVEAVDGLYLADLPYSKIEEMQAFEGKDNPILLMLWMSENLLRDVNGDRFEDMMTEDQIREIPFQFLCSIIHEVTAVMHGMAQGKTEG